MIEHKKDETININTRYPQEVRDAMKQLAEDHGRSFNGEVIWALREYIKHQQKGRGKNANKDV